MKRLIPFVVALAASSCSGQHSSDTTTPPSQLTVEQASELGVAAARAIAACNHDDTLELQRYIIDAYATRSEMVLNGNDDAAKAFDESLSHELRLVDPTVAHELFP